MTTGQPDDRDHATWLRDLLDSQREVTSTTPQLIADIRSFIARFEPEYLLRASFFERLHAMRRHKTDLDLTSKHITTQRMIDYVQSVIAATPPPPSQCPIITEDEWRELHALLHLLFETHMEAHHTVLFEKRLETQITASNIPHLSTSLESQLIRYWYTVWRRFHYAHVGQYLDDILLPHSKTFEALYSVSSADVSRGLRRAYAQLVYGVHNAAQAFESLARSVVTATGTASDIDELRGNPDHLIELAKSVGWGAHAEHIVDRTHGPGVFDIGENTTLPESLLRDLSWTPGEDSEFFGSGDEHPGSPLRSWPIFRRPFIHIGGRYLCYDGARMIDHLHHSLYDIVRRRDPQLATRWHATESHQMEHHATRYLKRLLPGGTFYTNVHFSGSGSTGEVDIIAIYDDHMLVVEVKSGHYTSIPPALDFNAHLDSVKKLGIASARQGQKFLDYLRSSDTVMVYDSNRKRTRRRVAQLRHADYRHVTICVITLEQFTEFAAQIDHLSPIGLHVGDVPIWILSLADLYMYLDIFDNPLLFLHYLEQRHSAAQLEVLMLDDELYHIGLYLRENNYRHYVEELTRGENVAAMSFAGYREPVDRFFHERSKNPRTPRRLRQQMPRRLGDIIDQMAIKPRRGNARVSSHLLDQSGDTRRMVADMIDQELAQQPETQRSLALTFITNIDEDNTAVPLTIFCWSPFTGPRRPDVARRTAQVQLVMGGDQERLLLELTYSRRGGIRDVSWTWIERREIPSSEIPSLEREAEQKRRERKGAKINDLSRRRGQGNEQSLRRIGRNSPCPCGSGKKYKRCCIGITPANPGAGRPMEYLQ
ncbi:MAG: hypothetical protein F4Y69_04700 [Chloroflexi bacterium]|nr:hypothetical protein [Chloroflexota bacterium]MYB23031.1 hypothetical protein [Chloroflexota bacterium]MYF22174.1 hypothetical protein [Chloroflexota bacterium]MYI04285.1 hypothetical protein [Chloroflexota bacterium]